MIDALKNLLSDEMSADEKANIIREFLQELSLKIINDAGFFKNLSFTGGTSLRVLYDMQRYSEDIDFSLIHTKGYNFNSCTEILKKKLIHHGLKTEIKKNTGKAVQTAFVKFNGLLYVLGISPHRTKKLSIKIEVDTNPPRGWKTEVSLINRRFLYTVVHFDLPSSFATKLHACFFRKYTKGRDIYDFLWYIGKNIKPNFTLLNNAIRQTEGENPGLNSENFAGFLLDKIQKINFPVAKKDVERFIINKEELKLFDPALLGKIIINKYPFLA